MSDLAITVPILVVDDDPIARRYLTDVLGGPGYTIIEAGSGDDALRVLAGTEVAAVLLDLDLPGQDGFTTARRIRGPGGNEGPPVLLITGARPEDFPVDEGYALGAVDYLNKPVSPPALRSKVGVFAELFRRAERVRALERARAEAAEGRLRLMVEAATDYAIFATDPGGVVTDWNAGAERLFGWAGEEIVGRHVGVLYTPEDRAAGVPGQELARAIGHGRSEDERWQVRKDGSRFFASGVITPIRGTGPAAGFARVARDETVRKRADEATRKEARRKDEFLAVLGHELRNALAPVRTGLHVLELVAADLPPAARTVRGMMGRQVGHLVRLVDDLLDLSRITRGQLDLRRERLDLRDVVREAVETSRPAVTAGRHALAVDLPAEPVWVDGDPTRLTQVVANLLNNAAKYTPDGGRIRVAVGGEDGRQVIRVRDNGVGIPGNFLPRVFDPFTQAEDHRGRHQGGLGIGLALVRQLVELHGGTAEAYSDGTGRGSEFVVRLPPAAG